MVEPVSASAALDPPPFGLRIGHLALDAVLSPQLYSDGSPLIRDPLYGILVAPDEYRRVVSAEHTLLRYPCGVSAGDRLCLREQLRLQNHLGAPIGQTIGAGSIWTVLAGLPSEPDVVWFEDPRGEIHTWDDASIWLDFQALDAA